jgi:hypothetical protein
MTHYRKNKIAESDTSEKQKKRIAETLQREQK